MVQISKRSLYGKEAEQAARQDSESANFEDSSNKDVCTLKEANGDEL